MENSLDFIPTKSSILNKDVKNGFEAVTYISYKKKAKEKSNATDKNLHSTTNAVFDVKKTRHEILKFGMSGFDQQKKQEAKIQLAIKLGAKPPKNVFKNYKQLLQEKKDRKVVEKQNLQFQQLGKNEFGESLAKSKKLNRKRKILKGSLLEAYGTVKAKTNTTIIGICVKTVYEPTYIYSSGIAS